LQMFVMKQLSMQQDWVEKMFHKIILNMQLRELLPVCVQFIFTPKLANPKSLYIIELLSFQSSSDVILMHVIYRP